MKKIGGIIVPILTPINEQETPCLDQLERLTDYIIKGGVNAIFANGTTGEFARFSHEERTKILHTIIQTTKGKIPVLAGVSDCGTRAVIENIHRAEEAGADAVVTTMPYYFPTSSIYEQREFIRDIAAATKLSVILYNIPSTTGCSLKEQALDDVYELPNLYGIKDSSGDAAYYERLRKRYGAKLKIFIGDEKLNFYGLTHGADGLVPSLANPFPKILSAAWEAAQKEDWENCRLHCDLVNTMNELNNFSDSWMSPNIWRKEALAQIGIMNALFTKPHPPISASNQKKIAYWISYYEKHYV